jgi:hypothetical protein
MATAAGSAVTGGVGGLWRPGGVTLLLVICWSALAFETQLTTEATTSTTGSIMTAGGLGIQKKLNVGGAASVAGSATIAGVITSTATTASTTSTTGAIITSGGLGVQLNANVGGNLGVKGTTAITGNTAITGTLSITGATTIAGAITSTASTAASSSTTGALKTAGGLGVQANYNSGGNVVVGGDLVVTGTCTGTCVASSTLDTVTASAVNADFTSGFATYKKDANKWKKSTHVPSAEIGVTGASVGDVCVVSIQTTGTTNFAPVVGKDKGNVNLFCYVSSANNVVVILSIGSKDVSLDTGSEYDGDDDLAKILPVNIAVIAT